MAGATGEDAKVQLVIARRAGAKSASGFSAQMAALGEEPEEVGGAYLSNHTPLDTVNNTKRFQLIHLVSFMYHTIYGHIILPLHGDKVASTITGFHTLRLSA